MSVYHEFSLSRNVNSELNEYEWTHLQDNITLDNFDEIVMNLSGAVRGAAMNEQEQTTSNLAMVTAAFARSAQLTNEMTVIQNTVS